MYNFQKLSETASLRCNNSSENSVPKRYGYVFFTSPRKAIWYSGNVAAMSKFMHLIGRERITCKKYIMAYGNWLEIPANFKSVFH
jgi:hypothetical protein